MSARYDHNRPSSPAPPPRKWPDGFAYLKRKPYWEMTPEEIYYTFLHEEGWPKWEKATFAEKQTAIGISQRLKGQL